MHLVSSTYNIVNFTATQMEHMETLLTDVYLNTLDVDKNGNWSSKEKIQDNVYSICILNQPIATRSNAQDKEERVQQLRAKLQDIKGKVTKNLKDNIHDQYDNNTFHYNWSGLELSGLQKSI